MTPPSATSPPRRRWRLQGYGGSKHKDLLHDSLVHGDAALDDAVRRLERRGDITKIQAAPAW